MPAKNFFRTKKSSPKDPAGRHAGVDATGSRDDRGNNSNTGGETMNYISERVQLRQSQLADLIEEACQHLEPSPYQREVAQQRYEGVGDWLAKSEDPLLAEIAIRLQGSVAIGPPSSRSALPNTTWIWWRTFPISTPSSRRQCSSIASATALGPTGTTLRYWWKCRAAGD